LTTFAAGGGGKGACGAGLFLTTGWKKWTLCVLYHKRNSYSFLNKLIKKGN